MRRLATWGLLVLALLAVAPAARAYNRVVGCNVYGEGTPWSWGGTVAVRDAEYDVIVGTGTLGANGCFEVYMPNGPAVNATVTFNTGPRGRPNDFVCAVPRDPEATVEPYSCGTYNVDTGIAAVSLAGFSASSFPLAAAVSVFSVLLLAAWRAIRRASRGAPGFTYRPVTARRVVHDGCNGKQ